MRTVALFSLSESADDSAAWAAETCRMCGATASTCEMALHALARTCTPPTTSEDCQRSVSNNSGWLRNLLIKRGSVKAQRQHHAVVRTFIEDSVAGTAERVMRESR